MMLSETSHGGVSSFESSIADYMQAVLQTDCQVRKLTATKGLPRFIIDFYELYEAVVFGRSCTLMVADETPQDVLTLGRHAKIVSDRLGVVAIVVLPSLDGRQRSRLVAAGVSFLVVGNQLFVPPLAVELNERFTPVRAKVNTHLSPTSQMLILSALLDREEWPRTTKRLSARLGVAPMSVIRSFDEIEGMGLAQPDRQGKERIIRFDASGRELFERCLPFMRDPVRTVREFPNLLAYPQLPSAGEHALSLLTDLSPPKTPVFAAYSRALSVVPFNANPSGDGSKGFDVESWAYDPVALGGDSIVDPLSLFVRFRDHSDERVSLAASSVLETFKW